MKHSCFILLTLATVLTFNAVASGTPAPLTIRVAGSKTANDSLLRVGNEPFQGRKWYYNYNTQMTWVEAREFCLENGMHLGSIKTESEFQLLVGAWSTEFAGEHWIDGRDSQTASQFTWSFVGFEVAEPIIDFGGVDIPYQLCLYYWSVSYLSKTRAAFCDEKFKVLCEMDVED